MFNINELSSILGMSKPNVMEIGVGPANKTRIADFMGLGCECVMVEALPRFASELERCYGSKPNVGVLHCAIGDKNETIKLHDRGEGSWIVNLPSSPDIQMKGVEVDPLMCHEVYSVTLDRIDDGEIDVLLIDTEGAEYYALKHMISRPRIIVLETHYNGNGMTYCNHFMPEIKCWMAANGYAEIARETSDTLYIKKGA